MAESGANSINSFSVALRRNFEHFQEAHNVEKNMRRLKREALEKGELTDVSFLVGPDNDKAELVHCFKSDLLVSSEYFRALFRSPLTGPSPIRLKHIQPQIFRILSKQISTSNLFVKNLSLEDAVDLAHAADEFLLDHLMSYYLKTIRNMMKVENLWMVLNRSSIPQVKAICKEDLTALTRECLAHETFLEASKESFVYLLQLDVMNIESESELVAACLKLANSKPEKEKVLLIKAALPHLRLLTLRTDEIQQELLEYLSDLDRSHLLLMMCLRSKVKSSRTPEASDSTFENVCHIKKKRIKYGACEESFPLPKLKGSHILSIIPLSQIFITDIAQMFRTKLTDNYYCYLNIVPAYNMLLTGIDILTPAIQEPLFSVKENSDELALEKVQFSVTIDVCYKKRKIFQQEVHINQSYNTWHHIKLDKEVVIPRGVEHKDPSVL